MALSLWKGEKALKEIERIKANYAMGILFNNKDDYIKDRHFKSEAIK